MFVDLVGIDPPYWEPRAAKAIERENLAPMRGWNVAASKARNASSPTVGDILVVGDEIGEGNAGDGSDAGSYFGQLRAAVAVAINRVGYYGRWVPAGSGWYPNDRFSANGTATEGTDGLSLRARVMAAGDPTASNTQYCDRILVHYRMRNLFASAHIVITIDGVQVLDQGTFDNSTPPYCTVAFGERVAIFDSGPLAPGAHTVTIKQKSVGGFNGTIVWDGAFFHNGDYASGVRVWNSSHAGANFATYNTANNTTRNLGHLSVVRQGLLVPSLVVWALGVNAGVNLSTIESSMRQAISDVWAAQDVASQVHCSQALVIPYATGTTTDSTWNGVRDIYYKVAASLGCAVWDWAELTGSVSHPTGGPNEDVYGMTSDNVHPGTTGQVMIGSWLSNKVLQALSPSLPAEVVAADGALRFKRIYESANYH